MAVEGHVNGSNFTKHVAAHLMTLPPRLAAAEIYDIAARDGGRDLSFCKSLTEAMSKIDPVFALDVMESYVTMYGS